MSNHLATYLNDHLAGSHSALEMLAALREIPGLEDWGARMTEEIGADQAELENLMGNLQIDRGVVRQAAGWVSGRLAELKTRIDDRKGVIFSVSNFSSFWPSVSRARRRCGLRCRQRLQ
jgi:hypothetical protein